jgi:4-hydroxybenzoate polyprenyltransferase
MDGDLMTTAVSTPGGRRRFGVVRDLLTALRPHQWVKNGLIFVSPLAAHVLMEPGVLPRLLWLFVAFCAAASGVYVANDLLDLKHDRAHPRKRERPFASGRLPVIAGVASPVLMLTGLWLGLTLSPLTGGLVAAYIALSLAYSTYLKRQPLVDVFALSGLYTLRLLSGELSVGIESSVWLLSFSGFLFLSLAFLKRVSEYQAMFKSNTSYDAGRGYTPGDVEMIKVMGVCASFLATLVLALYINTDTAADEYERPLILWAAVPVFLFWQSRMWLSAARDFMTDDPIVYAVRDWVSQLCFALLTGIYVVASFL